MFSIGGISWAMLLAALGILAMLILAPAVADTRAAEVQRNNIQASLDQDDQKIALQKEFLKATSDPLVLQRLAERGLNIQRPDQRVLPLDPNAAQQDRSVTKLIAERLQPVTPKPVAAVPWYFQPALSPALRPMLFTVAIAGLLLSFLLGVRFTPR